MHGHRLLPSAARAVNGCPTTPPLLLLPRTRSELATERKTKAKSDRPPRAVRSGTSAPAPTAGSAPSFLSAVASGLRSVLSGPAAPPPPTSAPPAAFPMPSSVLSPVAELSESHASTFSAAGAAFAADAAADAEEEAAEALADDVDVAMVAERSRRREANDGLATQLFRMGKGGKAYAPSPYTSSGGGSGPRSAPGGDGGGGGAGKRS